MAKASTSDDDGRNCITTDVYHDGDEVACRARSTHGRAAHEPVTDADGDVVWYADTEPDEPGPCKVVDADHDDAEPRPVCALRGGDESAVDFMLSTTRDVSHRPPCSYCTGTNGDPAKGSGNMTPARRLRYGGDWGDD